MTPNLFRRPAGVRTRRSKTTCCVHLALEDLEQRTVLSDATMMAAVPPPTAAVEVGSVTNYAAQAKLTGFTFNNITSNSSGQLAVNATLSLIANRTPITIPLSIPIGTMSISQQPAADPADPPVTTLHLVLGAINLSVLGLNVHLGGAPAFGDTTPITVNLVGIQTGSTYLGQFTLQTYQGGVLGDVVAGLGNLLGSDGNGGGLSQLLNQINTNLTDLLNGLLGNASSTPPTSGNQTEVLYLPIGPVALDLLGALVETSPIYLNLTATPGPGNLLGNLLGGNLLGTMTT